MIFWAAVVALVVGAFVYVGDLSSALPSALVSLAEIGGVVALFTLVCAAEVFSIPKGSSFDKGSPTPEA
ncbi:hypothetical protein KBI52_19120 [Microvirga sp. HBU67558]|uniref:hypothetical protein n=1 Tax=Microvirga TaxID=186650 RepID=UPI001B36D4F3|nr:MULTISPECIES: hypothetical protein [unclassified Microvirga]MBQ0822304.1 hypothetical protein [Microvirga sp. HBU67558]